MKDETPGSFFDLMGRWGGQAPPNKFVIKIYIHSEILTFNVLEDLHII